MHAFIYSKHARVRPPHRNTVFTAEALLEESPQALNCFVLEWEELLCPENEGYESGSTAKFMPGNQQILHFIA